MLFVLSFFFFVMVMCRYFLCGSSGFIFMFLWFSLFILVWRLLFFLCAGVFYSFVGTLMVDFVTCRSTYPCGTNGGCFSWPMASGSKISECRDRLENWVWLKHFCSCLFWVVRGSFTTVKLALSLKTVTSWEEWGRNFFFLWILHFGFRSILWICSMFGGKVFCLVRLDI